MPLVFAIANFDPVNFAILVPGLYQPSHHVKVVSMENTKNKFYSPLWYVKVAGKDKLPKIQKHLVHCAQKERTKQIPTPSHMNVKHVAKVKNLLRLHWFAINAKTANIKRKTVYPSFNVNFVQLVFHLPRQPLFAQLVLQDNSKVMIMY